jgi:hypothetical protein
MRAKTSRYEVRHLGHAFEDDGGIGEPASGFALRHHRHARDQTVDGGWCEEAECGKSCQGGAHLLERLLGDPRVVRGSARLDVDDRYGIARVGEHHGDAAGHAAGAETGNGRALAHLKPCASTAWRPAASR